MHGRGSRIAVRPREGGIDLGGRCVIEEELDQDAVREVLDRASRLR